MLLEIYATATVSYQWLQLLHPKQSNGAAEAVSLTFPGAPLTLRGIAAECKEALFSQASAGLDYLWAGAALTKASSIPLCAAICSTAPLRAATACVADFLPLGPCSSCILAPLQMTGIPHQAAVYMDMCPSCAEAAPHEMTKLLLFQVLYRSRSSR